MRRLFNISFLLVIATIISFPTTADAVQVFLETSDNFYNQSETFYVLVRLDTQGECVNAVKVDVAYNPEMISVKDVGIGDSVLTLWTQFPTIQKNEGKEVGSVVFEGGVPGGYCGRVIGDPGLTNVLAKLVVSGVPQTLGEGATTTQIVIGPATQVFLHDGTGREASSTVLGVELALTHSSTSLTDIWLSDVRQDEISPDFFEITFVEGPSVGSDKHYIVFNTVDKQSGIDHYEVLETDPDRFGFLSWIPRESYWVVATSPYTLRDQHLRSKILVKAVDKNGNERVVTFTPPMSPLAELANSKSFLAILFSLLVVIVVLGSIVLRRRKNKKIQNSAQNEVNEDIHG